MTCRDSFSRPRGPCLWPAVACTTGIVLALLVAAPAPAATAGGLDSSFSGNGWLETTFPGQGYIAEAEGVAVQGDGRIVAGGYATTRGGSLEGGGYNLAIARYRPRGRLDPSFSGDGRVVTRFKLRTDAGPARTDSIGAGVAIQGNGKIVSAGSAGYHSVYAVSRYRHDGSLDRSFSGDGRATANLPGSFDQGNDVAIQDDGEVVVAGNKGLVRFRRDGGLDSTFANSGKLSGIVVEAVAIQSDRKIVTVSPDCSLRRFLTNGSPDLGFSGDGTAEPPQALLDESGICRRLAIQDDGRIVAAGASRKPGRRPGFALVRFESDGSIDTSFGHGGLKRTDFGRNAQATGLAIQPDGRIVAGGSLSNPTDVALARYRRNGAVDRSFSGNGKARTDLGGAEFVDDLALQPHKGRILVSGTRRLVGHGPDGFLLAGYRG